MRTTEQINRIKKTHSESTQLLNVINQDKITSLLEHYHASEKIEKNTGPKVVYVEDGEGVIDDILDLLRKQFGNFKVRSAHYFDVTSPHVLHIDDSFEYPDVYKAFTIPLWVDKGDCNKIKLVMFDQYYYGGPVKLFNGEQDLDIPFYYNQPLYDYSEVENTNKNGIPQPIRNVLTHLKDNWLEGLSVKGFFPWTIGSIIAFDSLRIHCSSDFTKLGVGRKIGLSIFTEIQ